MWSLSATVNHLQERAFKKKFKSTLVTPCRPSMTGKRKTFPFTLSFQFSFLTKLNVNCHRNLKEAIEDEEVGPYQLDIRSRIAALAGEFHIEKSFLSICFKRSATFWWVRERARGIPRRPLWVVEPPILPFLSVSLLLRFWFIHEQCVARQRRSRTAFQKKAKRISKIFFFSSFFSVCFFHLLLR